MESGALAGDLSEGAILIRGKRKRYIVLIEKIADASAFLRRVERAWRDCVNGDFVHIKIPHGRVNVAIAPEPSVAPGVESRRGNFTRRLGVAGRKKLDFVKRMPVASGPGQQGQQKACGHQQAGASELQPIGRSVPP